MKFDAAKRRSIHTLNINYTIMDLTSILIWVVLGAIAGFLANMIKPNGFGTIGTVLSGIAGAFIGGYVGNMLGIGGTAVGGLSIASVVTAVVGALILSFILGFIKKAT